uniref:Alpha 1,3-galactosyltransferase 2 n=1 Tax=Neogobius melanostomus TaxID=47308 RepID=A0A8C6TK26_9GOBI
MQTWGERANSTQKGPFQVGIEPGPSSCGARALTTVLKAPWHSPTFQTSHTRSAVQTQTDWKAPIMWEGIWEPLDYDRIHADNKTSVALTVFARTLGYLEAYLETFLVSAEKHFMIGLPVMYYVFTERPDDVPKIDLAPHRYLRVIRVERHSRWQDISMMRMKTISELIDSEMKYLFSHVFCFDVDQRFMGRFGSEALGESVALLHAHFYKLPKNRFTYDRNPKSKAYMEIGDYYYHAAIFGGSWESVKAIADACLASIIEDKQNGVEALWHDESHLNKYFWIHKPSKLLSLHIYDIRRSTPHPRVIHAQPLLIDRCTFNKKKKIDIG